MSDTLRAAATMAPEALEYHIEQTRPIHKTSEAITALRAALAEHYCDTHCTWADHADGCVRAEPVREQLRIEGTT